MRPEGSSFFWQPLPQPSDCCRVEDFWVLSPATLWTIDDTGCIAKSTNGGESWVSQARFPGSRLFAIGFADAYHGWVGAGYPDGPLLCTADGGSHWRRAENLPPDLEEIRGICAIDARTVVAVGGGYATQSAFMIATEDGGISWTRTDLSDSAAILSDVFFASRLEGWIVGGAAAADRPDVVRPLILHSLDGGHSWRDSLAADEQPAGPEYCSRIQVLGPRHLVASGESADQVAIYRSTDGGSSWQRMLLAEGGPYAHAEGLGFLDELHGWVGGWGGMTSLSGVSLETHDGGSTWQDGNDLIRRFNRFRVCPRQTSFAYASGDGIYRLAAQPAQPTDVASHMVRRLKRSIEARSRATIEVAIPAEATTVRVDIWERLGRRVRTIRIRVTPSQQVLDFVWDMSDSDGRPVPAGAYLLRISAGDHSESRIVYRI